MHLILRADGTAEIGVGHLMRGLALIEGWVARGGTASLLGTAPAAVATRFEQAGAEVIDVPWDPQPSPAELLNLRVVLRRSGPGSWIVVDGYRFDDRYSAALRGTGASVAVVDDTAGNDAYDCDLLVNQNLGSEQLHYRINPSAELLRGARYVMLRNEFRARLWPPRQHPPVADRVLVTLGGGDPDNVTARVVDALGRSDASHLQARVVMGQANTRGRDALKAMSFDRARIDLIEHADMPALMAWATMAVSAAGSTAWEAAFAGLPTLLIVTAANQAGVARELHQVGAAISLGNAADVTTNDIAAALAGLSRQRDGRARIGATAESLIDGGGVERVIDRCIARPLRDLGLRLTRAAASERRGVWQLANAEDVRRNAFHAEPIGWESHCRWFDEKIVAPDTCFEVAADPTAAEAVAAQIRYDRRDDGVAEIDFAVAAPWRGRGVGAALLSDSIERACTALGARAARGVVFADNVASAAAFRRAGFVVTERASRGGRDCVVFERRVSGRVHA